MQFEVFISYPNQDHVMAEAATAALENVGIKCWIASRDIPPGINWGEAIIDAIARARIMVLIFSRHANSSHQVKREVERAASKGIPILPVRIENSAPAKSLEFFISSSHWLDALTPPPEKHLQRLVTSVKALLENSTFEQPQEEYVPRSSASVVSRHDRSIITDYLMIVGRLLATAHLMQTAGKSGIAIDDGIKSICLISEFSSNDIGYIWTLLNIPVDIRSNLTTWPLTSRVSLNEHSRVVRRAVVARSRNMEIVWKIVCALGYILWVEAPNEQSEQLLSLLREVNTGPIDERGIALGLSSADRDERVQRIEMIKSLLVDKIA